MPVLYIIAGPNGAGKTTAAKVLLPEVFHCDIFINADEIAAQLNPENVEAVAFLAGRIMLQQIEETLQQKATFAIETTLATRSYLNRVRKAQLLSYEVVLIFFYLPSAEMAKQRVTYRVERGGHSIPPDVIDRRYHFGIKNLFTYMDLVDRWHIYDNSITPPGKIAEGEREGGINIIKFEEWEKLKKT